MCAAHAQHHAPVQLKRRVSQPMQGAHAHVLVAYTRPFCLQKLVQSVEFELLDLFGRGDSVSVALHVLPE